MSPQVSFFMLPEEAFTFLREQVEYGAKIVANDSATPSAQSLTVEQARERHHAEPLRLYLLEPSCSLASVRMLNIELNGKPRWFVDDLRSPVVQVDPTFFGQKEVHPGRLYFIPKYFDGDARTEKPESVRAWAAWVMRRLRRTLTKIPGELAYASEAVYKQAAAGEITLMIGGSPAVPSPSSLT